MLCLSLTPGEYLTIGSNVIILFDRMSGDRCKMVIHAHREVPVLRGEVLERAGGERPECVFAAPRWRRPEISWDQSKAQALASMRKVLSEMDGQDSRVQALQKQLDHMFPPVQRGKAKQTSAVSNG